MLTIYSSWNFDIDSDVDAGEGVEAAAIEKRLISTSTIVINLSTRCISRLTSNFHS